jgi:hypothetical protein
MPRRGDGGETETEERESGVDSDMSAGFEDDLREFLEADCVDVDADPLFRERLRRKLWAALLRQIDAADGGGSED